MTLLLHLYFTFFSLSTIFHANDALSPLYVVQVQRQFFFFYATAVTFNCTFSLEHTPCPVLLLYERVAAQFSSSQLCQMMGFEGITSLVFFFTRSNCAYLLPLSCSYGENATHSLINLLLLKLARQLLLFLSLCNWSSAVAHARGRRLLCVGERERER